VKTLEEHAELPIVNPVEMGQPDTPARRAWPDRRHPGIQDASERSSAVRPTPAICCAPSPPTKHAVSFDSPVRSLHRGRLHGHRRRRKRGWSSSQPARCNKCHALSEQKRDTTSFTDNDSTTSAVGIIRTTSWCWAARPRGDQGGRDVARSDRAAIQRTCRALRPLFSSRGTRAICGLQDAGSQNVL